MTSILETLAQPQTLIRAISIAALVIFATKSIRWFGPSIGGLLAAMPMVTGPAYLIMLMQHETAFVAETAAYSLNYTGASQVFLLVSIACIRRLGAGRSFFSAALAWFVMILVLGLLPPLPWLGALTFLTITWLTRRAARAFLPKTPPSPKSEQDWTILLKGASAGVLVALSTSIAATIGSSWSGVLLVFPIAFVVLCATALKIYGRDILISTLYSSMRGSTSLVAFVFTIASLLPVLPAWLTFIAALMAALAVTFALGWLVSRSSKGQSR